jgi:hypothetical protein
MSYNVFHIFISISWLQRYKIFSKNDGNKQNYFSKNDGNNIFLYSYLCTARFGVHQGYEVKVKKFHKVILVLFSQ